MTTDVLPSALKVAAIDLARNYNVCELDGRIVLSTADSEEATRVLALDPGRRCVVREGAVLRWGARVAAGEKSAAMIFLRKVGLVTGAPVKSHTEMRERIAPPRPVVHRDVKPENNPPPRPPSPAQTPGDTMPTCKTPGCKNPTIKPRESSPPWRAAFCPPCIDRLRNRYGKSGPGPTDSIEAVRAAPKARPSPKSATKQAAKAERRAAPADVLTVHAPSASSIEYHLQHAQRCVSIVAQLGGIERAERIAEALA